MPEDRRLAAIMFTDIVGYSSLMGEDEERAFQLLKKNRQVQKPIIEKHDGTWLKEIGDGVLASFPTVSEAVYCAKEIQEDCEKEPDLKLRIGIHLGEVIFEDEDVFGDGVNIASRLEPLAPIGGIYVSESVHKNVLNKRGIVTRFIREEKLRNVKESVRIYEIVVKKGVNQAEPQEKKKFQSKLALIMVSALIIIIAVFLVWKYLLKQPIVEIEKSIAVLPFRNDSPDRGNEYFCNGMMEDILDHLAKINDLQVLSRTDVEPYRDSPKARKEIASELGVANLLEGSVRKQGSRFKITLQLINAENGFHLWSDSYEGEYTDQLFEVQSNIAKQVASALEAVITPQEKKNIERVPTNDIKAYDFGKRGWSNLVKYQNTLNKEYSRRSIDLFKKAIEFDSAYIQAYPVLISLYMNTFNYDSMIYFINKLKKIDPNNVEGYYFNGVYLMVFNDADKAIEELSKALELTNNNHMWARVALGSVYCNFKKDYARGIHHINIAIAECPEETKNTMYSWLINTLIHVGEYEKAEQYIQESMQIKAGCFEILSKNLVLISQGKYERAKQFTDSICNERQCQSFCDWSKFIYNFNIGDFSKCETYYRLWKETGTFNLKLINWTNINWAYVCHKLNKNEEANRIIEELIHDSERQLEKGYYWSLLDLSRIYAYKNDKEKCLRYLTDYEKYGFSSGYHDYILIDPLFENLIDDPDFLEIVYRVQMDKAKARDQIQKLIEEGLL